jgi:N-[(2S)-2-amino-2-carboxyethyl]-L-glutamate dehydrogenase
MSSHISTFPPLVIRGNDLVSPVEILEPEVLHDIAMNVWRDVQAGLTVGKKSVLYPNEAELWSDSEYAKLRSVLGEERLGWKLSALSAVGRNYAAVKIVGANALNRHIGLSRSSSAILLLEKASMRPLCLMDGTDVSAARTGTYASVVAETLFANQNFNVFIFGGGPVAHWVCRVLAAVRGRDIDALWVKTRSIQSALALKAKLSGIRLAITAAKDTSFLAEADLVITASNASEPLFAAEQLKDGAVILHLGGDETPAAYFAAMLPQGAVACDDVDMVSARGSSSLARYFSRQNTSVAMQAPHWGIKSLPSLVTGESPPIRPLHVTCVGIPSLDLYVAQYVYQKCLAQRHQGRVSHGSGERHE